MRDAQISLKPSSFEAIWLASQLSATFQQSRGLAPFAATLGWTTDATLDLVSQMNLRRHTVASLFAPFLRNPR